MLFLLEPFDLLHRHPSANQQRLLHRHGQDAVRGLVYTFANPLGRPRIIGPKKQNRIAVIADRAGCRLVERFELRDALDNDAAENVSGSAYTDRIRKTGDRAAAGKVVHNSVY